MVGTSVGPYEIVSRLGAGGMGEVFLGHDPRLQRRVALKCLTAKAGSADLHARILREARAAARLNHPNIAAVYDVIDAPDDGRTFIVMEYVEGESLGALAARERVPLDRVRAIGRQLASALSSAHAQGVIHRDLKPANILVARGGAIKVLDFGVAKLSASLAANTGAATGAMPSEPTLPGNPGTPIYMSPEQLFSRDIDGRSDIYSAGVVLYELATGRRPYEESGAVALALAISSGPAAPARTLNPDVPQDLSDAIGKALQRDAGKRFQSAAEFDAALATSGESSLSAETASRSGSRLRVSGWRQIAMTAVAAGVLATIGVVERGPLLRALGVRPVVTVTVPPVLAILPISNVSGDPRGEYLGAGILSVVAQNFGSVKPVAVLSRASVPVDKSGRVDLLGLERDQAATYAFDVTVQQVSPQLQIAARLLHVSSGTSAWSRMLHGDALTVERQLLDDLAGALEQGALMPRRFTGDERQRLRKLPTSSVEALMAYSEASALVSRHQSADIDRGIELVERATVIDPSFTLAWVLLADAHWNKYQRDKAPEDVTRAAAAVKQALAIDPGQAPALYALANMQYRTGQVNEAATSLTKVLELQPDNGQALSLMGLVLADQGQIDAAIEKLEQAFRVRRLPLNAFNLGWVEYRVGRYAQALDAFRQATDLAPTDVDAFQMLAMTQYVLGDVQQAIGNFEHAVRLGPTAKAYANLGTVYYETGKYDEAARAYEEAVKRDPRSVQNHRNIGDIYRRLGRSADARLAYARAVSAAVDILVVNPRDVSTIGLVALCEAKLGRTRDAEAHAAEAVALAPTNREALQRSAEVHALLGNPTAALRDLQAAVAHGFEPRMARSDDELASLRTLPRFSEILAARENTTVKEGAQK